MIGFVFHRNGVLDPGDYVRALDDGLYDVLFDLAEFGRDEWAGGVRKNRGDLAESIDYEIQNSLDGISVRIASFGLDPVRIEVDEHGRRAGARMSPPGSLDSWYEDKGIDKRADFAIRRSIAERGIPATHAAEFAERGIDVRISADSALYGQRIEGRLDGAAS